MGYLILNQPIRVLDGGQARDYRAGVNKDVTPEQAEHWYVKAAGGQYFEKLEDAHKQTPGAREEVVRLRSEWETAQRSAIQSALSAEALRSDLVSAEREFGIDTRAADKVFRESMKEQEARMRELQDAAEERNASQMEQDASSPTSPAQAEIIAAGSAEVANTQMDGPAKAQAERDAAKTSESMGVGADAGPEEAPKAADVPKPSPEEVRAAGSEENANRAEAGIKPTDPVDAKPKTTLKK